MRPNFMSVGGYDGMHLIYEALKKTNGDDRRRGAGRRDEGLGLDQPARSDLDRSRDARHHPEHLYPRRSRSVDGKLYNVEFATIPSVKDPAKAAAK